MLIGLFVNICKLRNKIVYMMCSLILIFVSIHYNIYNFNGFLRCLQIVPAASFFYVMGNITHSHIREIAKNKNLKTSMLFIIAFCMCFVIANINHPVLWYKNEYGSLMMFLMGSVLGCISVFYFSMFIYASKILKYVGKFCVAFYVWQFLIVSLSRSVSVRFLKSFSEIKNDNVVTILAFAIALPALYLIVSVTTKYLPVIYGYKKSVYKPAP